MGFLHLGPDDNHIRVQGSGEECEGIVDDGFSSVLHWSRTAKRWLFGGTSGLSPGRISTESCLHLLQGS